MSDDFEVGNSNSTLPIAKEGYRLTVLHTQNHIPPTSSYVTNKVTNWRRLNSDTVNGKRGQQEIQKWFSDNKIQHPWNNINMV